MFNQKSIYKSRFCDIQVTENNWCLTVFNLGSKLTGHSVMILEGLVKSHENNFITHVFKQFDILTSDGENITDIREFNAPAKRGYTGSNHSIAVKSIDAMKVLWEIGIDKTNLHNQQLLPYSSFPTGDKYNCAKWITDKLKVAGIIDSHALFNMPETLAKGCYFKM